VNAWRHPDRNRLGAAPQLCFETVAKHLRRIYVKLGVEIRTTAAARALAALSPAGC
jgi:DNA-binding NarL/FixJ family response regulator